MKLVKQTLIAAAVGASLFGGAVHAAAIATAYLEISDLVVTDLAGRTLAIPTDLVPADVQNPIRNIGDTRATLDGVSADETLDAPPAPVNDVGGAGFSCVGACTYVNNTFTYLTKPADAASSYVVSDVVLTGAIVEGIPGSTAGANAKVLAESAVLPDSVGSAESNVGTISAFEFTSAVTTDLTFSGAFDAYLRAALIGNLDGESANSEIGWTVNLRNAATGALFSWSLTEDDDWVTSSISTSFPGTDFEEAFGGDFSVSTTGDFLQAGSLYQLTINHTALADSRASLVAVPAPLALMGAGLLLLGGIQRRRMRSAAV